MGLIVVGKKSSKRAAPGDVFRIDLTTKQVVWGRVVSTSARAGGGASGLTLLYLFRPRAVTAVPPAHLPVSELWFPPILTNNLGFSRGYFTLVERRPFAPGERLATHCFAWAIDGLFHDENGAVLDAPVEPVAAGSIASYASIEDRIARALGEPEALDDAPTAAAPRAPLDERRFWSLVDAARAGAKSQRGWAESLGTELEALSLADLIAFDAAFAERMRRAHDWRLWGAAYLLDDGASDDEFRAFRAWLVFQGRDVFEAALKDPESLASFAGHGDFDAEELLSVAKKRVDAKSDDVFDAAPVDEREPKGRRFEEAKLAAEYPRLAKAVAAS